MHARGMNRIAAWGLVIASGLAAGAAWADEPAQSGGDAQPAPVLTGPKVDDRDVPGVTRSFGAGESARKFANRVPPQVLNEALEGLLADDAPAEIRATPEQAAQITVLREQFQKDMRAFQREHRAELQELRKQAGDFQRPREGQRPQRAPQGDAMQDGMTENPDVLAARERLRQIMDKAPKAEDVQVKAWTILNEAQKAHVEAEIQAYRDQEEMRRAERYVQERMRDREPGTPPGRPLADGDKNKKKPGPAEAGAGPQRPGADRIAPERRERLMRVFASLTPEQQDQLLNRLETRLREEGGADRPGPRGRRGDGRGEQKPAPKTEDIDVPETNEMTDESGNR